MRKPRQVDYQSPENDPVKHPKHYDLPGAPVLVEQSIDAIFAAGWGPGFCRGNALKYMTRAGAKDGEEELKDLKKARVYLDFLINHIETGHPRRLGEDHASS